jgi:hypothetical protein
MKKGITLHTEPDKYWLYCALTGILTTMYSLTPRMSNQERMTPSWQVPIYINKGQSFKHIALASNSEPSPKRECTNIFNVCTYINIVSHRENIIWHNKQEQC